MRSASPETSSHVIPFSLHSSNSVASGPVVGLLLLEVSEAQEVFSTEELVALKASPLLASLLQLLPLLAVISQTEFELQSKLDPIHNEWSGNHLCKELKEVCEDVVEPLYIAHFPNAERGAFHCPMSSGLNLSS